MASFTLQQLKEKFPNTQPKHVFSLEEAQRVGQLKQITRGNQFEEKPTGFLGKARDIATKIIGGGALARGAGQALASPSVQRTLTTEQRETEALQTKLLDLIRTRRDEGADVSRLEKALKQSQGLSTFLSDAQQDFGESLVSSKEVIGSAVRLGGTLGAGLITRTAAKGLALGKATTFLSGAARGAGAGAISGAVVGGIQGAGIGLEQEKDTKGVLKSAALGVASGALVGGAIGTVAGGVSGALKGRAISKSRQIEDIVSPKVTSKIGSEAIAKGELQDPTILGAGRLTPSKRTNQLADSVRGVFDPKAPTSQKVDSIRFAVKNTNDGVAKYVKDNNVIFNRGELKNALNRGKDDLDLLFTSDTLAEKTYNKVVEKAMAQVDVNDIDSLLSGRKSFDQLPAVQKLLNNDRLGENSKREIVLAVRKAANQYIASRLPVGNTFRADLLKQHNMLEALGNIADKAFDELGKNKIQLLNEQYPLLKWIIGAGILGGGVGAGGAFIGSTD